MKTSFQPSRRGSKKLYGVAALSVAAALMAGCAHDVAPDSSRESLGQAIQPIIKGVASGTEHDAVVVLTNFKNGQRWNLCTATMVAPNLLITARHCVSDTQSSAGCTQDGTASTGATVVADRPPSNLVVFAGTNGVVPNTEVEANGVARGTKLVVSEATTVCNEDIAFVVLDTKLTTPYAPIRLAPVSMAEKVSAVGWGVDESGNLPPHRTIRKDIALLGVGPGVYPDNPQYGYGSAEFMIGESACAGDSGGPTLSESGAVLGIASRAGNGQAKDPSNYAATCVGGNAHAVYTQLGSHKELVEKAFLEAGEPMWLEGEDDPRAPKPQTTPPAGDDPNDKPATTGGEGQDEASKEANPATTTAAALPGDESTGGCSMTTDPQKGSVEYAAGLVALFATLLGLRRKLSRRPPARGRLPSMP